MNEYVQSKVNPPGIALAVFGGAAMAANLFLGLWQLIATLRLVNAVGAEAWAQSAALSQGSSVLGSVTGFFVSVVVLLAGMRLRQARSPGLVYTGAIFAMLPCCVGPWCCCVGLPLGVWAILVLQDDQVKAAFAEA